jgi:TldD protein
MVADPFADLSPALVESLLARALRSGGEFAELFVEDRRSLSVRLEDGRIEDVSSGADRGASIRLVRGETTSFGYADSLDEPALVALADRLSASMSEAPSLPASLGVVILAPIRAVRRDPESVDTAAKADVLRAIDEVARGRSSEVRQVVASYSEGRQQVLVGNSRGTYARDDRTRLVLGVSVVAQRGDVIQTGRETLAGLTGYELVEDADIAAFAGDVADRTIVMLGSDPSPAGRMPVVLAGGFGGVLFHEAVGHGLEADFIVKRTSIWEGRLGQKVAGDFVTAYDDGISAGMWGSGLIDDEGTPSERTAVVDHGVLSSYLTDLLRGEKLGMRSTGNGRRQSYRHLPYPRMTNTYFAPTGLAAADLIGDTPRAFYAKSLAGGQVDPATGDFVFGVSEGYLIEDGRIGRPVRGATLIGNGAAVLESIDAVADDLDVRAGMCGKEGQAVPVGTGQPTLRLRELTVGGTSI